MRMKRFAALLATVLLTAVLCMTVATAAEAEQVAWYTDGVYRAGSDIPAGQYYVTCTDTNMAAYYGVAEDTTGSLDSVISSGNTDSFAFVTVQQGEYLDIRRAKATLAENVPAIAERGPGMYRVGVDIPAGQYRLEATQSLKNGYVSILADTRKAASQIVSDESFRGYTYVTVTDGQYLELVRCKIAGQSGGVDYSVEANWQWGTTGGVDRSRQPAADFSPHVD